MSFARGLGRIPPLKSAISVLTYLVYAAATFGACLLAASILHGLLNGNFKSTSEFIDLLKGSASETAVLAIAAGAIAAGVGLRQLRATREARWIETVSEIQGIWSEPEAIRQRRMIFESLTKESLPDEGELIVAGSRCKGMSPAQVKRIEALCKKWEESEETRDMTRAIKSALNDMERTALLLHQSLAPHEQTIGWVSPMVLKLWVRVHLFVYYRRAVRPNESADFYVNAERLYKTCRAWRKWRGHEPIELESADARKIWF